MSPTRAEQEIHELKTSLCAVLSMSNEVNRHRNWSTARHEALEEMHEAVQSASALIRTYAADLLVEDLA